MSLLFTRLIFVIFILFESLNLVGILHFSLTYSWQGLIITSFAVWVLMEIMYRKKLLHPNFLYLILIPIILDVIGDIFKLYTNVPHFAKFLHFTNSAIFAAILLSSIYLINKKITGLNYWFTWTTVVAVGAMYDLEEFWESIFLHTNRYVGGAAELTDITADCFGAIFAILVVWLIIKLKKHWIIGGKKATKSDILK